MKQTDKPLLLGRCLLAGLLDGLITSVVILVFNVLYREATALYTYDIVMPFSIFTAFPLFGLASGGAYYLFANHLHRGNALFTIVWISVMAILVILTIFTGHSVPTGFEGYRGLFVGIELITGLLAAFLIPFFAHHPNLYLTPEDIRGEE
jgi:hypothetical protein